MAFTFRALTTQSAQTHSATVTVSKPTGTLENDMIFAFFTVEAGGDVVAAPAGWTLQASQPTSGYRWRVYNKYAGASEPSTYDFTVTANNKYKATLVSYYNFNLLDTIEAVSATEYYTNNTTLRAASLSTTQNNSPLIFFGGVAYSTAQSFTKPADIGSSTWTEDYDGGDTTSDWWQCIYSTTLATAGATGNIDATISSSRITKAAIVIALNPAPPIVTTQAVSSIAQTTATGNGNITATGGTNAYQRGVASVPGASGDITFAAVTNPSFEVWSAGTTSPPDGWWSSFGTGNASARSTDKYYGSYAAQFTSASSGDIRLARHTVALTQNKTYTIYAWIKRVSGAGTQMNWLVSDTNWSSTVSTTTSWALYSWTVKYTGATGTAYLDMHTGTANDVVLIDGFAIVQSPNDTPAIINFQSADTGTGAFTESLAGLTSKTAYRATAFATNPVGTSYGSTVAFTTLGDAPTVTTQDVTNITLTTATGNGNVTSDGGETITERGTCYSTTANPTTANTKDIAAGTTGAFTTSIDTLSNGTLYHVRAYAINSVGTSYGADKTFTTLKPFVNPGNIYASDDTFTTSVESSAILGVEVSKNGGSTWSSKLYKTYDGTKTVLTFGTGATELWGTTWTMADMVDANFRVRITNGNSIQIYKTFGFSTGIQVLTGVEIAVEGKYVSTTLSLDLLEVRVYYGNSQITVKQGSQAYDSTYDTLALYDGSDWKNLATTDLETSGLYRQAIINGNFDVWQRGTSFTPADVTSTFFADRWFEYVDKNGGTLPTLTRTKGTLTSGDIDKSFYYTRIAFNGAGTSLGAVSQHVIEQRIEQGERYLCGAGKTLTLSFWARSDVANKKMYISGRQYYGTGGSPSAQDNLTGATFITLTSSWTKYTVTFTTVTLAGKTFGTAGDDFLEIDLRVMWGSSVASPAETYVGAGYIDMTQVQLCAGSVALPFQPKSFAEELRDCQRYYWRTSQDTTYTFVGSGYASSTTNAYIGVTLPVQMRRVPTAVEWAGANRLLLSNPSNQTVSAITLNTDGYSSKNIAVFGATSTGLTAGGYVMCYLAGSGGTTDYLAFTAEL
jgi:hypothetical protein